MPRGISYMLCPSVVDHGFEPREVQTKNCKIDICSFSAKHTAVRGKINTCLTQPEIALSEYRPINTNVRKSVDVNRVKGHAV